MGDTPAEVGEQNEDLSQTATEVVIDTESVDILSTPSTPLPTKQVPTVRIVHRQQRCDDFLSLPEELQLQVLFYLEEKDLCSLRFASKRCQILSDDDMLWKLLYFAKVGPCPSSSMTRERGGWKQLFVGAYQRMCWDPDKATYNVQLSRDQRRASLCKTSGNGIWGHLQGLQEMQGPGHWVYTIAITGTGKITVGVSKRNFFEGKHMHYNQGTFRKGGFGSRADAMQIGYNGSWGYHSDGYLMRSIAVGNPQLNIHYPEADLRKGDIVTISVKRRAQGTQLRWRKNTRKEAWALEIPAKSLILPSLDIPLFLTATLFDCDSAVTVISMAKHEEEV